MMQKELTSAEIHAKMLHLDEKIEDMEGRIAKAKSDLFHNNKRMTKVIFQGWRKELGRMKRERQRLQFEMGEAGRREKAAAAEARGALPLGR